MVHLQTHPTESPANRGTLSRNDASKLQFLQNNYSDFLKFPKQGPKDEHKLLFGNAPFETPRTSGIWAGYPSQKVISLVFEGGSQLFDPHPLAGNTSSPPVPGPSVYVCALCPCLILGPAPSFCSCDHKSPR